MRLDMNNVNDMGYMTKHKPKLVRVSVSLPEYVLAEFDQMVEEKHFDSRSQAVTEMIHQQVAQHKEDLGEEIMAGTISLVYEHTVPKLQTHLSHLQNTYLDEVISCLNVNLTQAQTMAVFLVQGPAHKLKKIADLMISQRGIITGKLLLSAAILPPVHPLPQDKSPI